MGFFLLFPKHTHIIIIEGHRRHVLRKEDLHEESNVPAAGGLMGELTTNGQYYLNIISDGSSRKYGLLPSQVDWEDVIYALEPGQTVYLAVLWEKTTETPLPAGTYSVNLYYQQHISMDDETYQTEKRLAVRFTIVD